MIVTIILIVIVVGVLIVVLILTLALRRIQKKQVQMVNSNDINKPECSGKD